MIISTDCGLSSNSPPTGARTTRGTRGTPFATRSPSRSKQARRCIFTRKSASAFACAHDRPPDRPPADTDSYFFVTAIPTAMGHPFQSHLVCMPNDVSGKSYSNTDRAVLTAASANDMLGLLSSRGHQERDWTPALRLCGWFPHVALIASPCSDLKEKLRDSIENTWPSSQYGPACFVIVLEPRFL